MRRSAAYAMAIVAAMAQAPPHAYAQGSQSLSEVLSFLLTNQAVPTGDFVKDEAAARATRDTVSRAVALELATLPIATSSPGFVYRLNHDLGTQERATQSFGPF